MGEFNSLEAFGRDFPRMAAELVRDIGAGVMAEMGRVALEEAQRIAPVGGPKDKKAGRLKRSLRMVAAHGAGDPVHVVSDSGDTPHATIIDRGRKRSKKIKGRAKRSRRKDAAPVAKGKMLGSNKARSGISRPTGRRVLAQGETIAAKVINDLESRT